MKSPGWLILNTLVDLFTAIGYVAINFFIWNNGNSFTDIIKFNLCVVTALLVSIFIAAGSLRIFGIKINYAFSLFIRAATFLYFASNLNQLSIQIIFTGILTGLYLGFYSGSKNLIARHIVEDEHLEKFISHNQIASFIALFLSPIFTALFINSIGYENTFRFISVSFFGILIAFLFLRFKNITHTYIITAQEIFKDEHLRKYAIIHFCLGISYTFSWGLLDILIIKISGSFAERTLLLSSSAVIGLICLLLFRRVKISKSYKAKLYILDATLIYSIISVLLLSNYSIDNFRIFIIATLVLNMIVAWLTTAYLKFLVPNTEANAKKEVSDQLIADFFKTLGALLPLLLLALVNEYLITPKSLLILLFVASLAPLIYVVSFKRLKIFLSTRK